MNESSENQDQEKSKRSVKYLIQYDGLSKGENTISLSDLGESLQGFSKILTSVGHLLVTGQYSRKYSVTGVTVTTTAQLEAGCIEIPVVISNIMPELFSGFAGATLSAVVAYVLSKRGKEEMEHLSKALQQSISQNKELQERLLGTIDKMADGLIAANRQALSPIGKSCKTISLLDENQEFVKADKELKTFFSKPTENKVTAETIFVVKFSELDLRNGSCKLTLEEYEATDERINGQISDPLLTTPNNPYVNAFANSSFIKVKGKAILSQENEVSKLFISDVVTE